MGSKLLTLKNNKYLREMITYMTLFSFIISNPSIGGSMSVGQIAFSGKYKVQP